MTIIIIKLKIYSSNLLFHSRNIGAGVTCKDNVKIKAAGANLSWFLIPYMGQAPKRLNLTFPLMQLNFDQIFCPVW